MSASASSGADPRAEAVETVAQRLLPSTALITRLLMRRVAGMSRADAGLLGALEAGPQRISELATGQALAQPTVTQLVARLEERGCVARGRDTSDGRVVLVSLTDDGRAALAAMRAEYRALLREQLAGRTDEEVQALAAATEMLHDLAELLQREIEP